MNLVRTKIESGFAEAAAATHGGFCPDHPQQQTGPAFDWYDAGSLRGTWGGGECGACNALGSGWVHTGARPLPVDSDEHEAFVEALKAEAVALRNEAAIGIEKKIRANLLAKLTDAIATQPFDHAPTENGEGWDAWSDWMDEHDIVDASSGSQGPLFIDGDSLSAWALHPCHPDDDGIFVAPRLTGESQ